MSNKNIIALLRDASLACCRYLIIIFRLFFCIFRLLDNIVNVVQQSTDCWSFVLENMSIPMMRFSFSTTVYHILCLTRQREKIGRIYKQIRYARPKVVFYILCIRCKYIEFRFVAINIRVQRYITCSLGRIYAIEEMVLFFIFYTVVIFACLTLI